MRISSMDMNSKHHGSFYCSATIKNGRVVSLFEDRGREGGDIWIRGGSNWNGGLQHCAEGLGRDFGFKFYRAVAKAAYKDAFRAVPTVRRSLREKEIGRAKKELDTAERVCRMAKRKYERLLKG